MTNRIIVDLLFFAGGLLTAAPAIWYSRIVIENLRHNKASLEKCIHAHEERAANYDNVILVQSKIEELYKRQISAQECMIDHLEKSRRRVV